MVSLTSRYQGSGKPYEGKPHVRFDEGWLETVYEKGIIAAGVHQSIAHRLCRLVARIGIAEDVLFDGGTALNAGMQQALEDELLLSLIVAPNPQITTALGATEMARKKYRSLNATDPDYNALANTRLGLKVMAK